MTDESRVDATHEGSDEPADERIREHYFELDVESTTMGVIVDPLDQEAWIVSNRPRRVEP